MSSIAVSEEWIAVSCGKVSFVSSLCNDKQVELKLPSPTRQPKKEKTPSAKAPPPDDIVNIFDGITFSPCGKWFAAYSSAKQLLLWETHEWTLVSHSYMPKSATSLKFSSDSQAVVIVDKAGDAIQFSLQNLNSDGEIILGHLSMILDVIITADNRQIITCDRDEKIRVSEYPNAYNIISYCLGHKEFVGSLCLLPHKPSILMSSSGDGTIRLWDFQSGKNLVTYDCSLVATEKLRRNPKVLSESEDGSPYSIIVQKVTAIKLSCETSLVCVLIHGYKGCLVFRVTGEAIYLSQTLCLEEVVSDLCFTKSGDLMIRVTMNQTDAVRLFSIDTTKSSFSENSCSSGLGLLLDKINILLKSAGKCHVSPRDVTQLLKRKFDNVKDYYEQKKARLGE